MIEMGAEHKSTQSKRTWQAIRARYAWHLRPPFDESFDRSHWWKAGSKIAPSAALYELARRHPQIGELRLKFLCASWNGQELRAPLTEAARRKLASESFVLLGRESNAVHCLCLIGLNSWPKLNDEDHEYWEDSVGSIKGIDCRHDLEKCNSITLSAMTDVLIERGAKLKRKCKGITNEEANTVIAEDFFFKNPPSAQEMETAVVREALAAHQQGNLLIAIAPDLEEGDAQMLLAKTHRRHWIFMPPEQRSRWWKQWLPLIAQFETEVLNRPSNEKINPQIFVHYRRALDGIRFEASKLGGHPTRCRHILLARDAFLEGFLNTKAKGSRKKPSLPIPSAK